MKRGEQLAPCRRDGACRNVIHQLSIGTNNHLTRNRSSFKVPCSEVAERWPSLSYTRGSHALMRSLPLLFPPRGASTRRRSVCYKTMIAYPVSRYAIKRRLNPDYLSDRIDVEETEPTSVPVLPFALAMKSLFSMGTVCTNVK